MAFGDWSGRTFAEVHESQPAALARWIAAPELGTPGGEAFAAVRERVRPWLADMEAQEATVAAITHASVVRAILAEALALPDRSVMQIDIAPLSETRLSFHRAWRLQELRGD
jgi:broad specificity phosphatase PhoE